MTLDKCVACNEQVSVNAVQCPHCGEPSPTRTHQVIAESQRQTNMNVRLFGGLVVIISLLVLAGWVMYWLP